MEHFYAGYWYWQNFLMYSVPYLDLMCNKEQENEQKLATQLGRNLDTAVVNKSV